MRLPGLLSRDHGGKLRGVRRRIGGDLLQELARLARRLGALGAWVQHIYLLGQKDDILGRLGAEAARPRVQAREAFGSHLSPGARRFDLRRSPGLIGLASITEGEGRQADKRDAHLQKTSI